MVVPFGCAGPCLQAQQPSLDRSRTGASTLALPGLPPSARRAALPVATASITAVHDLDVIVESAECSCDAGDDNPH
ncbi:hypothetical protein [Streptomyces sp. A 4/2]|uniref:hypothetical protein n=1 Tax=Streptomyces sp. A 4/2 TaxID=2934314 RepID=UPI002023C907|nr:hypothetical protein [Streptomyces sp. A 4/2]